MDDADIQIFATWFHNDRELGGGRTPAERYAARADMTAARISSSTAARPAEAVAGAVGRRSSACSARSRTTPNGRAGAASRPPMWRGYGASSA
jgi:hypothetical protein